MKFSMSFEYPFMYRPFITACLASGASLIVFWVKAQKVKRKISSVIVIVKVYDILFEYLISCSIKMNL